MKLFFNIIFSFFLILFLVSCSNKKVKQDNTKQQQAIQKITDPYAIFNGVDLEGWEISEFGTQGPIDVYDGKIVINYGDGASGITYIKDFPKVNYELSLEAQKTVGNDFFCGLTFPVKDDFCSLIVGGWGGPVVGLSCIDGKDAEENETKILKRFDKNVWYKIKLRVDSEKIQAWIDAEKIVDFEYQGRELYIRPEVQPSLPFGICTWLTSAEYKNIRLEQF